jgi:glucose-specific phosphotransferase system IIA component
MNGDVCTSSYPDWKNRTSYAACPFVAHMRQLACRRSRGYAGVSFAATWTPISSEEDEDKDSSCLVLKAAVDSTYVPLEDVPDPVVAEGHLGKGFAIEPAGSKAVAPVAGTLTAVFPTGHAYGITTSQGVEVLVHLGVDTVDLGGKGFAPAVKAGQKVKAGDLLCTMDADAIRAAGKDSVTMAIVTNGERSFRWSLPARSRASTMQGMQCSDAALPSMPQACCSGPCPEALGHWLTAEMFRFQDRAACAALSCPLSCLGALKYREMALAEGDVAFLLHLAKLLGKGGPFHIEVVSELLAAERDVEGTALVLDGFDIEVCHHVLPDALRGNEEAPPGEHQVLLGCIDKKPSGKLCCPPFWSGQYVVSWPEAWRGEIGCFIPRHERGDGEWHESRRYGPSGRTALKGS